MFAEIYSTRNCAWCTRAKNLMTNRGINYVERIIGLDITREKFLEFLPNAKTAPQIFIDGEYIGTYEQFEAFLKEKDNAVVADE